MNETTSLPRDIESIIALVLKSTGLRGSVRRDVENDLRNHFEDGLADGHSPNELIRRFGDPVDAGQRIGAATRQHRPGISALAGWPVSGRGGVSLERIVTEIRQSFRALRRAPGFTLLVLATLALGVGANTAVFSVLDAVLLRPLPYEDAQQLVRVEELYGSSDDGGLLEPADYLRAPLVVEMREWDQVFQNLATLYTYRETGADLTGGDRPERVIATRVSAGFFETLGAAPVLGRTFYEDESFGPGEYGGRDDALSVAVLSHSLWTRRFGSERSVVGRTILLNGVGVEVVGVMPRDFTTPLGTDPDVWVPQDLRLGGSNDWRNYYLTGVARVKDGLSLETAQARVDSLVRRVMESSPDSGDEWGVLLTPLQSDVVGSTRRSMLWLLAAAVGLVLLSACVNVGNLVFSRSLDREREVALMGALGSGRPGLVAHLLTENAILAFGGSILGLCLGMFSVRALLAVAPDALPALTQPELSPGVFVFALVSMVASLTVFGLAPTLRLSAVAPATALRSGGRTGTESFVLAKIRSTLVVAQVAVALVLMVGAGLLVRSFSELREVQLGVEPENVFTYEVHLPNARYAEGDDRQQFLDLFQQRVETIAGVETVGASSWLPLNGRYHIWSSIRSVTDDPEEARRTTGGADVRMIQGDYFEVMGIRLLVGRAPSEIDVEGEPVVWLSETVAQQVFPNQNPVGHWVRAVNGERKVAGVVGDVAWDSRGSTAPTVYTPHAQYADDRNWAMIQVVSARGDFDSLRQSIQQELALIDGDLVLFRPSAFEARLDSSRAQDRFALLLMGAFAFLAMSLAAVGTYGILAGSVARRKREIGIRMALGANAGLVRWGVMKSAFVMVGAGIGIGVGLAWFGSRWLTALLFQVEPSDPLTFAAAILALVGIGFAASFVPAQRAARVDPARSLAEE